MGIEVSFDAKTEDELLYQLVGACSSTRFWDGMNVDYPYACGTFIDENAKALAEAAKVHLAKLREAR